MAEQQQLAAVQNGALSQKIEATLCAVEQTTRTVEAQSAQIKAFECQLSDVSERLAGLETRPVDEPMTDVHIIVAEAVRKLSRAALSPTDPLQATDPWRGKWCRWLGTGLIWYWLMLLGRSGSRCTTCACE